MFADLRANPLKALIVLFIPALFAVFYLGYTIRLAQNANDGQLGAVLDDTWIHIRFADHIAQGKGLSYNDGVLTTGATSPLWVLLLAAAFKITGVSVTQQVNVAIVMSAAGLIACVLAITGFGWFISKRAWVGWLAGMMTALTGRMIWMGLSGMEITTFATLCVLALWSHVDDLRNGRGFGWRTGILTALTTLARPEGYLLAALIGMEVIFLGQRSKVKGQSEIQPHASSVSMFSVSLWFKMLSAWRGIIAYLLLAGVYPLVCLLISGYPLPNTFRVKSQLGREFPNLPFSLFWQPRVDFGWLVILTAIIGLFWLLHHRSRYKSVVEEGLKPSSTYTRFAGFVYPLWPIVFTLAVLFMGADRYVVNNSRYVAPAIPFQALLVAMGVMVVMGWVENFIQSNRATEQQRKGLIFYLLPFTFHIVLLFFAFYHGSKQPGYVANDMRQLRTMHVAAGEWVAQTTAPDALIALNDVGAIVHLSDRRVLDLEGLVSAEVIDASRGTTKHTCSRDIALMRLMLQERPTLIGVFPWWYPCMTGWPNALQPYNVFAITGPTVIAGGEMVFYQPIWENWPLQAALSPEAIPVEADFEQGISLVGYESIPVENGLQVTLWWRAQAVPENDYTVFVHLIDAAGGILNQHDRPPQDGRFLTTLWRQGDLIPDVHIIPITPDFTLDEAVGLRVGLYPTSGGANLPRVAAPQDQPNHILIPLP